MPVVPWPFARSMVTTLQMSAATNSRSPTSARPPARLTTPGGNRSVGRQRRRSRQVAGSDTRTIMPMFIVVPMDSTRLAPSGVLASGALWSSDAKIR